jgi:hypothetical protein
MEGAEVSVAEAAVGGEGALHSPLVVEADVLANVAFDFEFC